MNLRKRECSNQDNDFLAQLVRRAHEGLGHPGNDRLVRILESASASDEAIKIAKELKCSVCEQHAALYIHQGGQHCQDNGMSTRLLSASTQCIHPRRRAEEEASVEDRGLGIQISSVLSLRRHTASEARRAYLHWVKLFGPPTKLYVDLGREFLGAF